MFIKINKRKDVASDTLYVQYMVKDSSKKRPTLILLPGGPGGDHTIYSKQAETFFYSLDILMFDPRGCGKSSISDSSCYSMDVYIDDVEDIRQQLNLDSIVILGTSYGSMAAQGYAIKYGGKINLLAMILIAGAPSHEFIDAAELYLNKMGTKEQISAFHHLLSGQITTDDKLRDYFKIMAPLYSRSAKEGQTLHSARNDVRYNAQAALAGFGPQGFLRSFDWRDKLPSIITPTFMIVGEQDWINRPQQLKEIKTLIPKSQLTVIPDSGHFVWIDQKKKYFTAVMGFLKRIHLKPSFHH